MAIGINNFQNQNVQQQSSNPVSLNLSQRSVSTFDISNNTGISLSNRLDSLKSVLPKNLSTLNSVSQIVTKNQLTPEVLGNVINENKLKKFAGTNLFERLTDLDEEVEDTIAVVNADDDIKYLSFSVESSFIDDNLKNILANNSKEDIEIEFPRLVSHELNKSVHKSIFSTNECSILPEDIYRIKSSYYENTQIAFANNYFLSGENQKKYRKRYYENLKTTNDLLNRTYKNIFLINEAKVKTKRKLNFGNTITEFFLVEPKSSSLGKISSIILNNESVGFTNIFSNKNDTNSDIDNFVLNSNTSTFEYLKSEKNKIFDVVFSTISSESSFLKSAKEENFIVNTDRLVGQAITNLSLSINGLFKDSLSYEFYKSKIQNSENLESIKLVDSELYHDIPIIKIDSILSNETGSDLLFNPVNTDNAYTLGDSFFNFNSFSGTSIDNKNKFAEIGEGFYVNSKTFNIYKQNLFLENELNYNALILDGSSLKNTLESTNVTTKQKNYTDFHFNPYNFNLLSYKREDRDYKYNIAYLDIMPRSEDFNTYKNKLRDISSEGISFGTSKAILNSTSFTYFLKSNPINETMTMSNEYANKFEFICTESVSYLRSAGKTMRASLRHFIDPVSNTQTFINPMILEYKKPDIRYTLNNNDRSIIHGNDLDNEDLDYKSYVEKSLTLKSEDTVKYDSQDSPSSVINYISQDLEGYKVSLLNRFEGKKNKLGFMLLKNTLNPVPLEKIADKFIKYDSSLTTIDEYIPNRIVMLSSSKFKQVDSNSKRSVLQSPLQKNKEASFKKDNWAKISFDIRNSIFKLKKIKTSKSGNDQVIEFLNSFKSKAKKVSKVTDKTPYLSLLYSGVTKYALDKYEESPFIEKVGEENFKKFDYSLTSNNVKDSMELKINQDSSPSFEITSAQTKSFLSEFYPNSIFKSSSIYFEYVKDITRRAIPESVNSKSNLAYDKLMSDILLHDKNIDVASILAISSIIKYKNIDVKNDFDLINEKTDGLYEKYINAIFGVENVKKQKSFTLRTVDFPTGDNGYITRRPDNKPQYNPAGINFSDSTVANLNYESGNYQTNHPQYNIKIEDHEFDFGIVPGATYSYSFPFITTYYEVKPNNVCSCYRVNENKHMIVDFEQFKIKHNNAVRDAADRRRASREDVRQEDKQKELSGLYDYVYSKFYNYDMYLNAESGSSLYDFEENKAKIYSCIRLQKVEKDNKLLVNNTSLRTMLQRVTYTDDGDSAKKNYDDYIQKSLNYTSYGISVDEYAIGETSSQPYLKGKVNDIFINVLLYVLPNFEEEMNRLDSIETIVEFIKNNSDIVDVFMNLLRPLCNLYSTIFDEIIELSIKSNIYDKLTLESNGSFKKDISNIEMWDRQISMFFKDSLRNLSKKTYEFEKEIYKEDNSKFEETLYTQLLSDIQMISRTLNNSDICEIMTMDVIYSYVSEFERSQSSNIDILNVLNSLSNLENDLAIENPNNLLSDITRLNLISKIMNDYFYYQQKQYDDHCLTFQNNLNIDLRDHFVNIINNQDVSFYKNLLDIEKNKSILAEQGMMLLNHTYNRYDIMRFGIKQNFASFLSDKKILKFKFAIISHKNPDIYIPPIYKFYTPILTDITPSHVSLMKDQGKEEDGVFIDNYIGLYNNSSDIKQIYTVEHRAEAAIYILNYLLNKVNKERISEGSNYIIDSQGAEGVKTAFDIVSSAVFSSAVKYTNYRTQKNIDEISLNEIYDDKIGSISYLSAMSKEEFESTFSQNYENIEGALDIENIDMLSSEIIKRKINAVDFISAINKFTNDNVISNALADNNYYDIFSVVIGRKDIERVMLDYYDVNDIKDIVGSESVDKFLDSFSYMVEVEVI